MICVLESTSAAHVPADVVMLPLLLMVEASNSALSSITCTKALDERVTWKTGPSIRNKSAATNNPTKNDGLCRGIKLKIPRTRVCHGLPAGCRGAARLPPPPAIAGAGAEMFLGYGGGGATGVTTTGWAATPAAGSTTAAGGTAGAPFDLGR